MIKVKNKSREEQVFFPEEVLLKKHSANIGIKVFVRIAVLTKTKLRKVEGLAYVK
jgi:hypothetical protein